jgi:hypothetical protein
MLLYCKMRSEELVKVWFPFDFPIFVPFVFALTLPRN